MYLKGRRSSLSLGQNKNRWVCIVEEKMYFKYYNNLLILRGKENSSWHQMGLQNLTNGVSPGKLMYSSTGV